MARTQRPLSEPLRSWEGIRSDPHAPGNLLSEVELVRRRWESPTFLALRETMDAVKCTTKPYEYARSTLFGICLVSLLLRCHLRDAHRRVQSDPALRELFELPELTPETARRLAGAGRREHISEAGFPARTLIENFHNHWLPKHSELLDQLDTATYETLPLKAALRHKAFFPVTPDSETVYAREKMVPRLKARSDRMREQARAQGRADFRGLDRAVALGDDAFANTPLYEALYDNGKVAQPPPAPQALQARRAREVREASRPTI